MQTSINKPFTVKQENEQTNNKSGQVNMTLHFNNIRAEPSVSLETNQMIKLLDLYAQKGQQVPNFEF